MTRAWSRLSAVMFMVVVTAPVAVAATDLGIITGGEKGTYYQFGLNLQGLAKQHGVNLSVYPSRGSIENVFAVYQRPATQLGIVQSDVLAFVSRVQTDPGWPAFPDAPATSAPARTPRWWTQAKSSTGC
jgi:uncharacterized protein